MGRNKGEPEKVRGGYEQRLPPQNWLDKIPLAFLSKGESRDLEKLELMNDYLCRRNAQTEWPYESCNGERALLASISRQCHPNVQKKAHRLGVRCIEWAPVKGGESPRQNISLQTLKDLIQHNNPNESYRIYIVSENDTVFYVGQADNPISRICERLNPFAKKELFTTFLRTYIDDAYTSWKFQLLTLQDCESVVVKSLLKPQFDNEIIRSAIIEKYYSPKKKDMEWAMRQAERFLIWLYQPCINDQHTPFPTQLPAKYSDFSVPQSHV